MEKGILAAIGQTPLIELERLLPSSHFRSFAKLESLNPGGSAKDRPARSMIRQAMQEGLIDADTVIIESSSGNMGIGLAQACRYHGLRFICVIDTKTTRQNQQIMRLYGAELDLVEQPDPETGELLQARLKRVAQLREQFPKHFWPNQYANLENAAAHFETTMREIHEALAPEGGVDYVFVATSTCGTVRGCLDFVLRYDLATRVIAVDAQGSLIFQDRPGPRHVPGLGAGLCPPLCPSDELHHIVHVSDTDCVVGCQRLLRREAILAGGSAGGVVTALERFSDRIETGAKCVLILPDRGERYLDTIYSDAWVQEHCGDIEHLLGEDRG